VTSPDRLAEPLPMRLRLAGDGTAWRTALLGVALFAGGVATVRFLGRGPGPAIGGVCFALGIASLITSAVRWLAARQDRVLLAEMSAGDYIAFWIVPRDAWFEHLERERKALPNYLLICTAAGFGIAVAFAALVVGTEWWQGRDTAGYLLPTVSIVTGVAVVFGLVGAGMSFFNSARMRRLARTEPIICIADRALYHAGEVWPHDRGIPRFLGVELLPGPPRLLQFSYRYSSPKGSYTEVVRVPMPPTDKVIRPDEILERLNRA